jgi:hypothetical protein
VTTFYETIKNGVPKCRDLPEIPLYPPFSKGEIPVSSIGIKLVGASRVSRDIVPLLSSLWRREDGRDFCESFQVSKLFKVCEMVKSLKIFSVIPAKAGIQFFRIA